VIRSEVSFSGQINASAARVLAQEIVIRMRQV
jgi:hypothetical protein